jgi:AAA domain
MTIALAQVQELFALKNSGDTYVGHYDDPAILERHAQRLNAEGYHIYTTINPINPEFARNINGAPTRGARAGSQHIARRLVLPYDIDTIRPVGQAANDAERRAAREATAKVVEFWRSKGVQPEVIDSGNGYQVRVPVDLPNNAEVGALLKSVLRTHKQQFATAGVKFDVLADAPRVMRMAGYTNWKGGGAPDRPHRKTKLLNAGSGLAALETLRAIAKDAPPIISEKTERVAGPADLDALETMKRAYHKRGEIEDILGLGIHMAGDHSTMSSMVNYLFNNWEEGKEDEKERLINVIERAWDEYGTSADGPRGQNEVEDLVEHAFRRKRAHLDWEPDCVYEALEAKQKEEREWDELLASNVSATKEGPSDWRGLFHTYDESLNAPPITFAIEGFLQEGGATMLGGLPGHGKTLVALAMVRSLLEGSPLFNHFATARPTDRVIYLIPESGLTPFVSRLRTFRLMDYVREGRLFFRTFSKDNEALLLTDPRLVEACRGADVFLDTAVRFIEGDENASTDQKVFAHNLFNLLRAGSRSVTGLHHSPKGSEKADYMSLENILRGSGELGAMLSSCWGIRQIDRQKNRLFIENVKSRDFQACESFIVEGRPHLDNEGYFKLTDSPGVAGSLNENKPRREGERPSGRPTDPDKLDKMARIRQLHADGRGSRDIAREVGLSYKTVLRWLTEDGRNAEPDEGQKPL